MGGHPQFKSRKAKSKKQKFQYFRLQGGILKKNDGKAGAHIPERNSFRKYAQASHWRWQFEASTTLNVQLALRNPFI